jgi:plasmid stability protein
MPQILVRDLDEGLVDRLKRQAKRHHRSLQGEVKAILVESAGMTPEELLAAAEAMQRRLAGGKFSDSVRLVREDRGR